MSCIKGVPVLTTDKLCDEKLKCSVCGAAREARKWSSNRAGSDRSSAAEPDHRRAITQPASR
jgi:hypothetical protein